MEEKKIIYCFIASPGDTKSERDVCEKVFSDINEGIGKLSNFMLKSLRWENDVHPGIGEDGQDVINKQIRGKYDLFIGIMNKRFGTPTKRGESGTVEEFNDAYNRAKESPSGEVMFYFNDTEPDSSTINKTQYKKVKSFRKKVGELGLYGTYSDTNDFEIKLKKDLTLYFTKLFPSKPEKEVYPEGNNETQITEGKRLKKYLEDNLGFRSISVPNDLSKRQGYLIWPIKLLRQITYIHKAQVQLIRLLTDLNWKLIVIIGDCGMHSSLRNTMEFRQNITALLNSENIPFSIATLSDFYQPHNSNIKNHTDDLIKQIHDDTNAALILEMFHEISDGLNWDEFYELITKNYGETKIDEIRSKRTLLHNIQPLLVWSLVAAIAKKDQSTSKSKSIVIAGGDEYNQWDYITQNVAQNSLGVIFIHELRDKENKTMDQEDIAIRDKEELLSKLDNGNMAEWLFTHFVGLPQFKNTERPPFCKLSEHNCIDYNHNCLHCLFTSGNHFNDKDFNKREFAGYIHPKINI